MHIPYSNILSYPEAVLQRCNGHGQRTGCRYPRLRTAVTVGRGPILARKPIIVCGSGRPILYVIMPPPSLGDVAVAGTAGTVPRLHQCIIHNSQNCRVSHATDHLSRDGENSQVMGRVGPTTASSTPEILTFQYVSGDTCRDNVQLETAVTTISQKNLLEFTSEYGVSNALHPELPGPEERIVDFPEGKVGVYTKFFEFANFRLPLLQFLFDILGYYQIHLSQLSVIGAAIVSHFEINCRVLNIIPTSISRVLYTIIQLRVDVFQQEAGEKYPSMLYQAIRFPKKLEQPLLLGGREGIPDYCGLTLKCSEGLDASREYLFPEGCDDTKHTSHPNPETTRSTTLLCRVEPQILPGR
uniref:Transposase (Putative), gypsy type n=1 Tax=Tanacetum cinerariifolium TaxID=118510 RepID=A0A699HCH7_TANCI|nr:hypothetical protein [Tanacetum cinerariifolium]